MGKYDKQRIEFDRRMAFLYGITAGIFIGIMIGAALWQNG